MPRPLIGADGASDGGGVRYRHTRAMGRDATVHHDPPTTAHVCLRTTPIGLK
ncbi:hypothetical protein [Megasphaera elsdenii]|uniref:hypothetical protein n=1 Tax=Megasphaera elsdenii TaxID=907 RepID=UPI00242E1EB5|nr:hypothetical protein [Megasphaera elsdenii]